ncbi:MAG: hypothetical protein ACK5HY_06170, partial [Parahaliea sp.]
ETRISVSDALPPALVNTVGPGLVYAPSLDRFIGWAGGNILYLIDPTTMNWKKLIFSGQAPSKANNGMYGRFAWSEAFGGLIIVDGIDTKVAFIRLSEASLNVATTPAPGDTDGMGEDDNGSGAIAGSNGQSSPVDGLTNPRSSIAVSDLNYHFIPNYYSTATRLPDREYYKVGSDLRGDEIGLFPAWDARAIATGDFSLALGLADATLSHYNWDAPETLFWAPWATPPGQGFSASHYPNLFFLPYLLTGDTKYIYPQEQLWRGFQSYSQRAPQQGIRPQSGRSLAWNLRTLAQLAWLQQRGLTREHYYLEALENTRQFLLAEMKRPHNAALHVLGIKINTNDEYTAWFESYIGQVVNYVCLLGFTEWKSIATWHFEHLRLRSGVKWPLLYSSGDHVKAGLSWEQTRPYNDQRMTLIADASLVRDQLPPEQITGVRITYRIRDWNARAWAAMAAANNIPGALEVYRKLDAAIKQRGSSQYQEFAITPP